MRADDTANLADAGEHSVFEPAGPELALAPVAHFSAF